MQSQRFLAVSVLFTFIAVGVAIHGSESTVAPTAVGAGTEIDRDSDEQRATGETRGFALLAVGWKWGCRAVALVVLIAGGLLISTEFAQGTLKLALSRPVRRCEVFLAKWIVLTAFAVVLTVAVLGGTWAYVGVITGFSEIRDPKYPEFIHFSMAAMSDAAWHAALQTILPILCLGAMGLLVSSLSPGSGTSVAVAILFHLLLDVMNEYLPIEAASWLFSHYLRMPTDILWEMSQAFSTRVSQLTSVGLAFKVYLVPAVSLILFIALAGIVFWRRDVPA
jgi:ABC-2 type transport system permease protein